MNITTSKTNTHRFACVLLIALAALTPQFKAVASAHVITPKKALEIAQSVLGDAQSVNLTQLAIGRRSVSGPSANPPYYIFNATSGEGFAIVSGDDRTERILGYSEKTTFDVDNVPPGLNWLLEQYAQYVEGLDDSAPSAYRSDVEGQDKPAISPMVTTKWGQGEPYNSMYPYANTNTGCVITAMAQILNYHQWPERGEGTFSYTESWKGEVLEFDYENTTFDWSLMADTYDANSSPESRDEVARLMYACCVGMEAANAYHLGTSSSVVMAKRFLLENFKYSAEAKIVHNTNYTLGDWENMIYNELQASRPVYMEGGNHAFVCDGYSGDGYFHFNWGWDGNSDGYFHFYTPEIKDIVNTSSTGLIAMINIHKREGEKEPYTYDLVATGEVGLGEFNGFLELISGGFYNYSYYDLDMADGGWGFEIVNVETKESFYHEEFSFDQYCFQKAEMSGPFVVLTGLGFNCFLWDLNPFDLAPGKYKLYPAWHTPGNPLQRISVMAGGKNHLNLTVTADEYGCLGTYSEAENPEVMLEEKMSLVGFIGQNGKEVDSINASLCEFNPVFKIENHSPEFFTFGMYYALYDQYYHLILKSDITFNFEPNSENKEYQRFPNFYLQPGLHQIKCYDRYDNIINDEPIYFEVYGEGPKVEVTNVTGEAIGFTAGGIACDFKFAFRCDCDSFCFVQPRRPFVVVVSQDGEEVRRGDMDCSIGFCSDYESEIDFFMGIDCILEEEINIEVYDYYGNRLHDSPFIIKVQNNIAEIKPLMNDNDEQVIYDLQGRKVSTGLQRELSKGIYIVNGKKVPY